jgi:DNA adenine methylase
VLNIDFEGVQMKAVLKYPGAKWSIADWIIDTFPDHRSYLEPFFGSGGVFFNKQPSGIETVNDLDGDVVNLFSWIKNDPEKLAHEIYFTPYSRKVYNDAYESVPSDSLQKALNFYIRCNMGHGFRTNGEKVGWKNDVQGREKAYAARDWANIPDKIMQAAERLRGVQIECMDAVELIKRFNDPKVLIYCDPPYTLGTRHGKQYRCEMTDDDHVRLLGALLQHKGYVAISGYRSKIYDDMLKGWNRIERTSYSQIMSKKTEVLWMNYESNKQLELNITQCNNVRTSHG